MPFIRHWACLLSLLIAFGLLQRAAAGDAKPEVKKVTVTSGVRSPQWMIWSSDLTLSGALGNCGGTDGFDDAFEIVRSGRQIGVFSVQKIATHQVEDPKLQPGDVINNVKVKRLSPR